LRELTFTRPGGEFGARIKFPDSDTIEHLIVTVLPEGRFLLQETPAFSEFASYGDTILAEPDGDGVLRCRKVVARSGLKTVRWFASKDFIESATWENARDRLMACGGNWEQLFGGYLILHIPMDSIADFQDVIEEARRDSSRGVS
jgi:hypothetical protein